MYVNICSRIAQRQRGRQRRFCLRRDSSIRHLRRSSSASSRYGNNGRNLEICLAGKAVIDFVARRRWPVVSDEKWPTNGAKTLVLAGRNSMLSSKMRIDMLRKRRNVAACIGNAHIFACAGEKRTWGVRARQNRCCSPYRYSILIERNVRCGEIARYIDLKWKRRFVLATHAERHVAMLSLEIYVKRGPGLARQLCNPPRLISQRQKRQAH